MTLGRDTALRTAGVVVAVGFAWAAVGAFTLGVYMVLLLYWGVLGAAFATAGICVVLSAGVAIIALRHASVPLVHSAPQPAALGQSTNLITALRELSQDHPLLAVCAAAVLGAVGESKGR